MTEQFDAIVIGAGQGGGPLANALAQAGRTTALIEREHIGGTCVNEGCTPTKTMIASGRVAYLARRAADYGVHTGEITIDMPVVRKRKRDMVDSFREGSEKSAFGTEGLTVLLGEGRFSGPKEVTVALNDGGSRTLAAETIVINVGERPAPSKIDGAETVTILNSTTVMELDSVPDHLLIIGGGYVGLEFGQLFRRLGAEVTIVHHGPQLLSREDTDIADAMRAILEEDGIRILLETSAKSVTGSDGDLTVTVEGADGTENISTSHILQAAGRIPNSDLLDLDVASIETDKKGYIVVDDRLATSVSGIYAVGDVVPGPKFTHISYDDYRILKVNLIDGESRSTNDRIVPYTVFTDPQLGRVGLSERAARDQGRAIRVARMPMARVARALESDESRGVMKVIVDPNNGQILGAAILGLDGGEVMSMVQIAMMGGLPYTALRDAVFAHPNLSESLNNLFFAFTDES
jgi:pyruvate/2-oxoglutarate dehydrogenase complex dihydrolipoamide dehydrogenase (E3) component